MMLVADDGTPALTDQAAQRIEELAVALNDAQQMLEHSQDAIMVLDDDRRCLAMNRAAAQLLARAPHEVLGRSVDEIFTLDDDAKATLEEVWALLLTQGNLRIDWPMILPGGAEIVLDVAATAHYRPGRHLSTMRDVTAARRDQAELAAREHRLRFLLEEIERMRDAERRRIAGDIHDHSLQHLIAARMTLDVGAELVGAERVDLESTARELLDSAILATRRLLQGLAPLHTEHRPLGETLTIGLRELAELHATPIVVDLDLPLQLTEEHRLVIVRIITEAAINACHHSGASEIRVWGRVDDTGLTTLRVSDDGCGFDPSILVPGPDGRAGVGLQLLRERVRAMNGTIDICTEAGHGTTVTLQIPRLGPDDPAGLAH